MQYAGQLLEPFPAAAVRRTRRAFGELLEWLDGHPLSMRLILPGLDVSEPDVLLEGFGAPSRCQTAMKAGTGHVTGRQHHLLLHPPSRANTAAIAAVAFSRVSPTADVLAGFSAVPGVPRRFARAVTRTGSMLWTTPPG